MYNINVGILPMYIIQTHTLMRLNSVAFNHFILHLYFYKKNQSFRICIMYKHKHVNIYNIDVYIYKTMYMYIHIYKHTYIYCCDRFRAGHILP